MKATFRAILCASTTLGAGLGVVVAAPAGAQNADDRERIVVTGAKREQTIEEVPFSINAQTQEDIQRTGSANLEDLSRNVAGLAIQNLGPGQSQVAIRGVSAGQIVRDQPGVKEQVGVYLDESVISLSLFTPDLDLYDLNRVETLRGPQGTLFGSGSVGGTLRYITNQPELDTQSGSIEANLNSVQDGGIGGHIKAMFNAPIAENTAVRAVFGHTEYGGFIDALGEGGAIEEDVNEGKRTSGRIAIRWEPNDRLAITPRVLYQSIETDGFNRQEVYNLYANPFTTTRPAVTFEERQQFLRRDEGLKDDLFLGDLTIEGQLGDITATSITSWMEREVLVSRDASALTGSVSVDLGYPDAGVLLASNLQDTTYLTQLTQEWRLTSADEQAFRWQIGAFFADINRDYAQRLPTPGYDAVTDATLGAGTSAAVANGFGPNSPYNADLPYNLQQIAFFGEASLDVTEKLTVTAGGRAYDYSEERRFLSGGLFANGDNQVDKTSADGFSPRVLASYEVNDTWTLNAQASQGFRLGGVNDPLNETLCNAQDLVQFGGFQAFGDEKLWNYEVGAKANTGAVRFGGALFHTDIEDLQVTLDAGSCSSRIVFNVPSAHTTGVELELFANPIEGLEIGVAATLLEAQFDTTVTDSTGAILGGVRKGNRVGSVPEQTYSLSATYSFPVTAFAREATGFVGGSWQYVGDRYTQPGDQEPSPVRTFVHGLPFGGAPADAATTINLQLPEYDILNLNAGLEFESFDILGYVNNVTDENALLSFDRERGGRARLGFHTNQPRTYGVTVRRAF